MLQQNWAAVARVRVLAVPLAAAIVPAITGMTVAQHCVAGVPQDARVERILILAPDTFGVVFSHKDWTLISMGGAVPLIDVQIEPLNVMQVPPQTMPPLEGVTVPNATDAPPAIVPDLDPLPDPVPVPTPEPLPFRRRPSPILLPGS